MFLKYKINIREGSAFKNPIITITTGEVPGMSAVNMIGNIITDDFDGNGLYDFVIDVLGSKNKKDEYWTNGYTAQFVRKDDKKMIKIFFRLSDEYEPYYIDPKEFKKIIELWIEEKKKFDKDPENYKKEANTLKEGKVIEI